MVILDPAMLYRQLDRLEGSEELLVLVRPVMFELVSNLINLPRSSLAEGALPMFKNCIVELNKFEGYIETVERESLLNVIYLLGELVGLPRGSEFAEEWRGDW